MPPFTFSDHDGFHRTALRLTLGAAAAGIAAWLLTLVFAEATVLRFAPALAALFAGAAAGHGARGARGAVLTGLWLAASLGSALLFPRHPTFGLLAAGGLVGFGLYRLRLGTLGADGNGGRPGRLTLVAAIATGAGGILAGHHAVTALVSHGILEQQLPELLAAALYGASFGLFLSLAAAGSHLMPDPDPVEVAHARAQLELTGEFRALAARAIEAYRQAQAALGAADGPARRELQHNLGEVTTRVIDLARRWQQVERDLGAAAEGELGKRLAEIQRLGAATSDAAAKRQYQIAEKTLEDELAQVARIRTGRERVVARLHGQMALLERTRFALVGLRSADAHRAGAELCSLSEGLGAIARELDAESEAIDEVHATA